MRKTVSMPESMRYVFHSCLRNIFGVKRPLFFKKSAASRTCRTVANEFASYSYDANSNRLTAIDKTSSDTDLDGGFDADDFTLSSVTVPKSP